MTHLKMFQTKVVETIKTQIPCSINFIFENLTLYEIKNMVETERPQIPIWRMRIAR